MNPESIAQGPAIRAGAYALLRLGAIPSPCREEKANSSSRHPVAVSFLGGWP